MNERRLLDLPYGYQTVIDEADWPQVRGLTLYRGTQLVLCLLAVACGACGWRVGL